MGFRLRKSIKIAPGVRLNVSKTGIGASAGVGAARYSVHSSGRKTVSARTGIPGVYYQKSVRSSRRQSSTQAPAPSPSRPSKPGLFAPKGEKQLYNAIRTQDVAAIGRVGDEHPNFRTAAYSLAGLMLLDDDPARAKTMLASVLAGDTDPAQDPFVSKYLATRLELPIAEGVTAELPVNPVMLSASPSPSFGRTKVISTGLSTLSSSWNRARTLPCRSPSCIYVRAASMRSSR